MIVHDETFGMLKTLLDAHTMGVNAAASLLRDCGYRVIISPPEIEDALDKISSYESQQKIIKWIKNNNISRLGISYRLDPDTAVDIVGRVINLLKSEELFESSGAIIKAIHFAGLKPACEQINREYSGRIKTFIGGETAEETLLIMGVPVEDIPQSIVNGCKYDKGLLEFGEKIIKSGEYKSQKPLQKKQYKELGGLNDTLELRLKHNFVEGFNPLIRAHSGPYSMGLTRCQCLDEYNNWCRDLADKGFLDILSIGTSQLSQSNFGEDWGNKLNGGGVPVNSEFDFLDIWNNSRPMLVRTYSATKNIREMAKMYDSTINNAWNALSIWWFDELDGRGPNTLYQNIREHIDTIRYAATTGKPVETNVPHHFAFRGCDDVTYVLSAFLSAKAAKYCGVHTYILQNMLNTPRSTWGIQDLAKSRAMLKLIKSLEDDSFTVILQTRAGLDYFKPDIEQAKIQLAAVTAMMDDIDYDNIFSPEIIHVVSYSEAMFLATPDILNDSIKITRDALAKYRRDKSQGLAPTINEDEIRNRMHTLISSVHNIITAMEANIPNLYSPEGLYIAFVSGWLPVPELWSDSSEFIYAKCWQTKMHNGGIHLVDHEVLMTDCQRINKCITNISDSKYILRQKYGVII